MSVTLRTITFRTLNILGTALPLARVTIQLKGMDLTADGAILGEEKTYFTDESGVLLATLVPNTAGTQATQYRVRIYHPYSQAKVIDELVTLSDVDSSFESLVGSIIPTPLTDAQIAVNVAAASATAAAASETAAALSAVAAANSLTSTNSDVVLTHADAVLSADSEGAAALSAIAAALSETNAATSESAAAASAVTAGVVAASVETVATEAENASVRAAEALASAIVSATQASAASVSAAAALSSEENAATSATSAGTAATSTAADAVATNLDKVATAADVILTGADVDTTNADVVLTASDLALTNADVILTHADVVLTHADAALTNVAAAAAATSASTTTTKASEAATSATNAATSASTATTQATASSNSATAAGISETNAANSETNTGNSAAAAGASETAASTSETNAATSASAAATSATNAAASETNAASSETSAASSAAGSALSQTEAATSSAAASVSETNAAASETNASGYATAAANSNTSAGLSAVAAASSETNAATSAVNAATSETNAASSASAAATSATNAASEVSNAISNIVDSSPSTLDTLNELAAALGDDPNFATTVTNSIALKAPIASPTFTGTATIPTADINAGTIDNTVIGGSTAAAITATTLNATGGGSLTGTWANLGTVTTVDLNGGTIDGTTIGATTPAAVTTTALVATTADINAGTIDGTVIGGSTAAAGSFTTGAFSGTVTADGLTVQTTNGLNAVLESTTSYQYLQFKNSGYTENYIDFTNRDFHVLCDNVNRFTINGTTGAATFSGDVGLPLGAIINFSGRGNITHDASTFDIAFNTNSLANAFVVKGTGAATFSGDVAVTKTAGNTAIMSVAGNGNTVGVTDAIIAQDGGNNVMYVVNRANAAINFGTNNAFGRMTLDASGNLLVGKTVTSSSTAGMLIGSNGRFDAVRDGGYVGYFNRLSSDGDIAIFAKDDTPVGSIGNSGTTAMYVGSGDTQLLFKADEDQMVPFSAGGYRDAAISLGRTNSRFKDLYLSGTVSAARATISGPITNGNAGLIAAASTAASDLGSAGMSVLKYDNSTSTSQVFFRFLINQGAAGCGQINANGPSSAAFGSWSDATLKENIIDLPDQYDNIRALRPVEFDYIESEGGGHQIGFIAQEMQEVYPCCVGERDDGKLTISGWNKTEARLVSALQSAMNKIEDLTARLEALEGA